MMREATQEELAAAGIKADCPMMSERRIGEPGRWRIGDDLVTRRGSDGGITHAFGYFTPAQVAARLAWAQQLNDAVRAASPLRRLLLE